MEVQDELDDVERKLERRYDSDRIGCDGKLYRMDGATSGTCSDSKRVETRPLARERQGEHGRHERTTVHVPGSPTRHRKYQGRPTYLPNLPHRRGKVKISATSISHTSPCECTHRAARTRRNRIGRIGRIYNGNTL